MNQTSVGSQAPLNNLVQLPRKNMAANGHAIISPSSATFWMNCEGQPALAKNFTSRSNKNAEWGTDCHEMAKPILITYFKDFKPMTFAHIEDRDKRAVVEAYSYFCVDKIYNNFVRGAEKSEVYVEVSLESLQDIVFGTGDFIVVREINGRRDLIVVDLKTGFHDVKIPENKQFINYAIGAMRKYSINGKISLIGFLPRVEKRTIPYEKWDIPADKIEYWEKDIAYKGTRAIQMYYGEIPIEVNPGEHCEWCPVQCPTRLAQIERETGLKILGGEELLTDLEVSPTTELLGLYPKVIQVIVDEAGVIPPSFDPESYTPEQLGVILAHEDSFKALFESAHARAERLIISGVPVPGRKVVATQTRRGWIKGSEEEIAEQLIERGMTDPWQKKLVGLGVVETTIGKGKIADLTEMSTASLTVVAASDKRVAYNPAADDKLLTDL